MKLRWLWGALLGVLTLLLVVGLGALIYGAIVPTTAPSGGGGAGSTFGSSINAFGMVFLSGLVFPQYALLAILVSGLSGAVVLEMVRNRNP